MSSWVRKISWKRRESADYGRAYVWFGDGVVRHQRADDFEYVDAQIEQRKFGAQAGRFSPAVRFGERGFYKRLSTVGTLAEAKSAVSAAASQHYGLGRSRRRVPAHVHRH